MKFAFAIAVLLISASVSAQTQYLVQPPVNGQKAPPQLVGVWGSSEQCVAYQRGKTDSPRLFPYHISDDWIEQGGIYCYLSWREAELADNGLLAFAFARCGEDNLLEYRLQLRLQQGRLRIRWSEDYTTRALEAC